MRTQNFKMLASTMQFSNNNPSKHTTGTPQPPNKTGIKMQAAMPRKTRNPNNPHPTKECGLLLPQDPTVCQTMKPPPPTTPFPNPHPPPTPKGTGRKHRPVLNTTSTSSHQFVDIPPMSTHRRTNACAMGILLTTPTPHTTWNGQL